MNRCVKGFYLFVIRHIISISCNIKFHDLIAALLEFRCNNILLFCHIHCKGNKGCRYMDIIEGAGHGVLTADGWQSETDLCCVCTEKRAHRLAPALCILSHTFEVFLECETNLTKITACCHNLSNRFCNRISSTVIWTPVGKIWVKTIAHHGDCICFAF